MKKKKIILNEDEQYHLFRQSPSSKHDGGFQSLLVSIQETFNPTDNSVTITDEVEERIRRYYGKYKTGGYQSRLRRIFGRTLLKVSNKVPAV